MVRLATENVLLIGDARHELRTALSRVTPAARVTSVATVFDGIAELAAPAGGAYTTVLAPAEPLERRPEAAVRALRDLAGDGRLVLFGDAGHETLGRRMRPLGCDDYLLLPPSDGEIRHLLDAPPGRRPPPPPDGNNGHAPVERAAAADEPDDAPPDAGEFFAHLPLADWVLDALVNHPQAPLPEVLRRINAAVAPVMELGYRRADETSPPAADGVLSRNVLAADGQPAGTLDLWIGADLDVAAETDLASLAGLLGKLAVLQDRHTRLQRLAITDELTGVANARYFRHFLARILDRAKKMHFPVTLLLFDIDNFKHYNDQFGHGVGDDILKQTAVLMKRCTREHDLVARIGGDEFAVVFWDKEGPRQPREPRPGNPSRPPQSPQQIFQRFKALIADAGFSALGPSGQGVLGVSAGLAVYPYDAQDPDALVREADRALMQGAKKRTGKNSIYIVGSDEPVASPGG